MLISAGRISPMRLEVRLLYSLQKAIRLMPCPASAGPIGGAGLAFPAWICKRTIALSFFATVIYLLCGDNGRLKGRPPTLQNKNRSCPALCLFYLQKVQFDRCFAAEEVNHHAHLGALHIELRYRTAEIVERPIHNAHPFTLLEGNFDARRLGF